MGMKNPSVYKAQSARDAQESGYGVVSGPVAVGGEHYWDYLEQHAQELHAYYLAKGDTVTAEKMLTRSLSDALRGNDGL
jgi:hypothetical protein